MATPSWNIPMAWTTCFLTSTSHTISKLDRKWSATAIKASLGQRLNQSIVQPLIRPGNFRDLLRNFSPTCIKRKKNQAILIIKSKKLVIDFCNKRKNAPARSRVLREDYASPASRNSRTDFPPWVVAWGTPSSSQESVRRRFRRFRHEQIDLRSPQRKVSCWGIRGSLPPWSLGQWRWMLFLDLAFLPLCKDTSSPPWGWMHCKTWRISSGICKLTDQQKIELTG